MKEPVVQSQRESTSELEDVLLWLQLQDIDIDSFSQSKNDEAVAWRSNAVRFKGYIYSDA